MPAGQTGGGQRGAERGRGNKNGKRETVEEVSPEKPHWNSGFIPRPPNPASQPLRGPFSSSRPGPMKKLAPRGQLVWAEGTSGPRAGCPRPFRGH